MVTWRLALLVFVGGGLGSVLRFLVGRWVSNFYENHFPLATLLANVTACFLMGCFVGAADQRNWLSPDARVFWTVGFCGGFSTFSAFSNETLVLLQGDHIPTALLYLLFSTAFCLAATWGGWYLMRG